MSYEDAMFRAVGKYYDSKNKKDLAEVLKIYEYLKERKIK